MSYNDSNSNNLEENLNCVIYDLVTGINDIAAMIRSRAESDAIAGRLEALAGTICDHWPDCFDRLKRAQ